MRRYLPPYQQFFNFRLPHKQNEDNEALNAVEEVAGIKNPRRHDHPGNGFHYPGCAHDDEQPQVQEKSETFRPSSSFATLDDSSWESHLSLSASAFECF